MKIGDNTGDKTGTEVLSDYSPLLHQTNIDDKTGTNTGTGIGLVNSDSFSFLAVSD
mgnify:CR=1 FL=1